MSLLAVIAEALRALRLNRLRTALTMLGMIIGVAAVVLMLAVGQGAQTTVNQAISSMGSNLLMVVPGATSSGALRSGAGSVQTLTMGDAVITHAREFIVRKRCDIASIEPIVPAGRRVQAAKYIHQCALA